MTISLGRARELLRPIPRAPVVYDLEEVEDIFGVMYTPEQRTALADIPFAEDVLTACAGTHMLFPSYPMSLLEIHVKHAVHFYTKTGGWYAEDKEHFSRTPLPIRWYLLRMEPVPGSYAKTWEEQQSLLVSNETVPSAAAVAFATMLHFRATKQRLFEHAYVQTSDIDAGGYRVCVGGFVSDGFYVSSLWDVYRHGTLGLSSEVLSLAVLKP